MVVFVLLKFAIKDFVNDRTGSCDSTAPALETFTDDFKVMTAGAKVLTALTVSLQETTFASWRIDLYYTIFSIAYFICL